MTQSKITFTYTETLPFQEPLSITMSAPERSLSEMCEYFQRFLFAAGYVFQENERIDVVRSEVKEPSNPIISEVENFQECNFPAFVNSPFGDDHIVFTGSGVCGGMSEDFINLG